MEKYYQISVGHTYEHSEDRKDVFTGNFSTVPIEFKTKEKALAVIAVAEIRHWRLSLVDENSSPFGDVVEESDTVREYFAEGRNETEEHDADIKAKAQRINTLPKIFLIETGVKGLAMHIHRSEYSYEPKWSRAHFRTGRVRIEYLRDGKTTRFWLHDYMSSDGKMLAVKFGQDLNYLFGKEIADRIKDRRALLSTIRDGYEKVRTLIKNA